jgi:hypothetical protein
MNKPGRRGGLDDNGAKIFRVPILGARSARPRGSSIQTASGPIRVPARLPLSL